MAQTITLCAQGAAILTDSRFNCPASSRASRYFISPAWPAAIHCGKYASSSKSRTGEIPARSNPATRAARLMNEEISCIECIGRESAADRLVSGYTGAGQKSGFEKEPPGLNKRHYFFFG